MSDPHNIRFDECAGCEGEGRDEYGICPHCNGTGREEIEVEPITLEDLEDVHAAHH